MGEDPSRIDRQIKANREHIAATLDAIAYQANVPARIAERSPVMLSGAVEFADTVATRIDEAARASTRAVPSPVAIRFQTFVPLAIASLLGVLVGLTWPKPARP